jgi:hypothetical protein
VDFSVSAPRHPEACVSSATPGIDHVTLSANSPASESPESFHAFSRARLESTPTETASDSAMSATIGAVIGISAGALAAGAGAIAFAVIRRRTHESSSRAESSDNLEG